MILLENKFSHLKGVNKQPYLDIRTYASHLTKTCLFSCFSCQSNSFSSKRFCRKTRFEREAQRNIHPWAAHRSLWLTAQREWFSNDWVLKVHVIWKLLSFGFGFTTVIKCWVHVVLTGLSWKTLCELLVLYYCVSEILCECSRS